MCKCLTSRCVESSDTDAFLLRQLGWGRTGVTETFDATATELSNQSANQAECSTFGQGRGPMSPVFNVLDGRSRLLAPTGHVRLQQNPGGMVQMADSGPGYSSSYSTTATVSLPSTNLLRLCGPGLCTLIWNPPNLALEFPAQPQSCS